MQTTMLEAPTTMTTLALHNLSTLTTMQTTMLEEPTTMIALTTVSTSSY